MKIVTSNAVYVQKSDLVYLNSTDLIIPATIYIKVFGSGKEIINEENQSEFVKFDEKSEIDYFKSIDWIVDYNKLRNLSNSELLELIWDTLKKEHEIAIKFNSMPYVQRRKNVQMRINANFLMCKYSSLMDILGLNEGETSVKIPDEIDFKSIVC